MGLISWLFPGMGSKDKKSKKNKKRGDDVWTYSIRFGRSIDDLDFSSPEDLANELESLSQIMERAGETDQVVAKKENQDGVVMFAELFNLPLETEVDELMDGFYGKERLPYDKRLIHGIPDDSKIDPYEPEEEVDHEEADRKFQELIYYAQQPKPADEDEPVQKTGSRQNADWLLEKNEEETQASEDGPVDDPRPQKATNVEETPQSSTNVAEAPQNATNAAPQAESEKEKEVQMLRQQLAENEDKELAALRQRVREQNELIRSYQDDKEAPQSSTNVAETPQSVTNVESGWAAVLDSDNDVAANVIKSLKAEQSKLAKEIAVDRTAEIKEQVKAESSKELEQAQHEAEAEVEQERQERVTSENARHANAIGQIEADAQKRLDNLKGKLPIEIADKAALTLKQRLADEEQAQAQRQKEKEILEQKINDALALFSN